MEKILWIIAICEIVRALQNALQITMLLHDTGARDNAYEEFVKSLKGSDREFVERMLREFKEEELGDEYHNEGRDPRQEARGL